MDGETVASILDTELPMGQVGFELMVRWLMFLSVADVALFKSRLH